MHYFAWIRLSGWYAAQLAPEANALFVLTHQKRVLDVAPEAARRGVKRGMAATEARSILPEGTFRAWKEGETEAAARTWWDALCDWTNGICPHLHHEAGMDLSGHPDPVAEGFVVQARLADALGLTVEIGMGGSPWVARLLCGRVPGELQEIAFREAIHHPGMAIADFSVTHLPIAPETSQRLFRLGYTTIGKVQEIDRAELVRQFGEEGHRVAMVCRGGVQDRFVPSYPPGMMLDTLAVEEGIQDLLSLERALAELSERLGERLLQADLAAKQVSLRVELEDGEVATRQRTFVKAIDRPLAVRVALNQMLATPPEKPIVRIQVRLGPLMKVRSIQRDLAGQTDRLERARSASTAIDRLRDALGERCIQLGSEVEEPRRQRVLRVWKDATGWR